jgi:hypothetical protein
VHLQWDGQQWLADGQRVQPQVMVDLGSWLLLRLQPQMQPAEARRRVNPFGRTSVRWMALSPAQCGAAMGPLRAAVYCFDNQTKPGSRMRAPE